MVYYKTMVEKDLWDMIFGSGYMLGLVNTSILMETTSLRYQQEYTSDVINLYLTLFLFRKYYIWNIVATNIIIIIILLFLFF